MEEVTLPGMEAVVRAIAEDHGFSQLDHELELFGTCAACAG